MGCPSDKILQVAEHWGVAGCSPGQSSLAAVPAGLCHIYAFVIDLLGLTPCAVNGLPHHGIQVQSQKVKSYFEQGWFPMLFGFQFDFLAFLFCIHREAAVVQLQNHDRAKICAGTDGKREKNKTGGTSAKVGRAWRTKIVNFKNRVCIRAALPKHETMDKCMVSGCHGNFGKYMHFYEECP